MPDEIKNFNSADYTDEFIRSLYTKKWQDYHYTHFRPKNNNFARILLKMYDWDSVVDFGCSIGSFLEVFLEANKKIKGYEYCYQESLESIRRVPNLEQHIEFGNVSTDLQAGVFDASVSIEVAEHIPTEYSESLVQNLVNSTRDLIIFTAATPNQGGTGHINCQKNEFWINLFEKQNCYYDKEETNKIKQNCIPTKVTELNTMPHIWAHVYKNLMIFRKKDTK